MLRKGNRGMAQNPGSGLAMPAHNPDFATLSEAAYDAADTTIAHMDGCPVCGDSNHFACPEGRRLGGDYRTKRDAALKAIRGPKTRGKK